MQNYHHSFVIFPQTTFLLSLLIQNVWKTQDDKKTYIIVDYLQPMDLIIYLIQCFNYVRKMELRITFLTVFNLKFDHLMCIIIWSPRRIANCCDSKWTLRLQNNNSHASQQTINQTRFNCLWHIIWQIMMTILIPQNNYKRYHQTGLS